MSGKRIRRKDFDPGYTDFRGAMHWLLEHGVSRSKIAAIFGETPNYVSVAFHNEDLKKKEPQPPPPESPDFTLAEPEIVVAEQPSSIDALEEEIEQLSASFWQNVRGLDGVLELGLLLRKPSQPDRENIPLLRLQSRIKHLLAETYLHAGYAKTAISFCDETVAEELDLYNQTHSREDLKRYAKTLMLNRLAHILREEWDSSWATLNIAQEAFDVAHMPIDPELHRQRASILMRRGDIKRAQKLYRRAFETFPAHRAHLGYGEEDHARYDVGVRPLAVLHGDLEAAEHNLEVAEAWPASDIHRAINLNWAVAAAYQVDSPQAELRAQEWLEQAHRESYGFGHQMTITRLLAFPRTRRCGQQNQIENGSICGFPKMGHDTSNRWTVLSSNPNSTKDRAWQSVTSRFRGIGVLTRPTYGCAPPRDEICLMPGQKHVADMEVGCYIAP